MSSRLWRRFIAVTTAMLFLLSIAGHGFVVAGMSNADGMAMAAAAADLSMPAAGVDCDMDCAKDTGMHMACAALCAGLTGILTESVWLPRVFAVGELPLAPADPLASVHGPPDPHPPKPRLI